MTATKIDVTSSHTNAGEYIWHNIPPLSSYTTSNTSYTTTNTLYYPMHLYKPYRHTLLRFRAVYVRSVDSSYYFAHSKSKLLSYSYNQDSAHTGREWSAPTTTHLFLPPLELKMAYFYHHSGRIIVLKCDIQCNIMPFSLQLSHHSDHSGQNPVECSTKQLSVSFQDFLLEF